MERNKQKITAVIWDLGGVIVRTLDHSGRAHWEEQLGLSSGELSALVFEGEMGCKASLGQASTDDVWNWVAGQLDLPHEARIKLERDFWKGDRVDRDLIRFIRDLHPAYQTGLLSNAWPDLRNAMENVWHIADAFDEIVISAEVGLVKPDTRIYYYILERMNINPEQAVFVDDFPENIAGARAVGMQAIHFRNPAQAIQDLEAILDLRHTNPNP
jgi:epoxide hydrolase-like predicted phosphatase